jgi:type IV secretion system protein VirB3
MSDRPRTIPIHLSLIRPILLMGAERELVLISGILAAVLVMSLARLLFTVVGVVFWGLSLAALQRAARSDPQFTRVYLRHTRYRGYYSAQSRATSRLSTVREGMPC